MAHYALIDENNVVTQVFVGRDENDLVEGIANWEIYYAPEGYTCKRTSYNTLGGVHANGGEPFRKNYAGVGYTYDAELDAFIPPKPYPSWILNEETCLWSPPIEPPQNTNPHRWDETSLSWVAVEAQ